MPKRVIFTEEWYPVFVMLPEEYTGTEFEVPQELIDRFDRVAAEFDLIQAELYKIVNNEEPPKGYGL